MRRAIRSLYRSDGGNVAPTVGLALFALIAAGGIAFDYARLASMDTELQNAADQAALAAAGQLDGQTGACARAAAAANDLLVNHTLFANEPTTTNQVIQVNNESACDAVGSVRFYQSYDQVNDTFGPASTSDADARVVAVQVNPREAFYALTPVVGAFRSGNISAEAVASLGSAICKVPPVMMCNPDEPDDNEILTFPFNPEAGAGLRLVIGSPDAPGNFGFLRTGEDGGAKETAKTVGYDISPSGCFKTNGVETEPGNMISVRAAFNTRFDISENGELTCPDGGTCSPSRNSRKDLVLGTDPADPALCHFHTTGWHEVTDPYKPYRARNMTPLSVSNPMIVDDPATTGVDETKAYPDTIGYPRDLCHATSVDGECAALTGNSIVGTGDWDIDAYFWVNYEWTRSQWMNMVRDASGAQLASVDEEVPSVSRYDIYLWEMRNPSTTIDDPNNNFSAPGHWAHSQPVCRGAGIDPYTSVSVPDRRRITVAVINCEAQNLRGHEENVQVLKWLDVFLVEPAIARGNGPNQRSRNGDIYVEVISGEDVGGNEDASVTRRDVPYLIR